MVVVAVIAISAALAAPALSEAMAVRRASEASHSLVRIGARARSESMAYGRAYLLTFDGAELATLQLWRGTTNLCSANDWADRVDAGDCSGDPNCVEQLSMQMYDHGTHRVVITQPVGALTMCFQPDGEVRFISGGPPAANAAWNTTAPDGSSEGLVFALDRQENGATAGVVRRVVFPYGSSPRILR